MKQPRELFATFDLIRVDDVQQPLSDERLLEITARCERATTGPWRVAVGDEIAENWMVCGGSELHDKYQTWSVETDYIHGSDVDGDAMWDAEFIAHARTDIPTLLVEIERLRAIVAKGWQR